MLEFFSKRAVIIGKFDHNHTKVEGIQITNAEAMCGLLDTATSKTSVVQQVSSSDNWKVDTWKQMQLEFSNANSCRCVFAHGGVCVLCD